MDIKSAKEIFIPDFLGQLGHLPVKIVGNQYLYKSPLREETVPSFWVDIKRNIFIDFGLPEGKRGGSIIDLAKFFLNTNSIPEALKFIEETMKTRSFSFSQQKDLQSEVAGNQIEIRKVSKLKNPALISYMEDERCISKRIAVKYCQEVYYSIGNKNYFSIGFLNKAGGWATRNKFFKGCLGPSDVSFIDNQKNLLYLFEGTFSFLSYLEAGFEPHNDQNYLILNSISNYTKAIEILKEHRNIYLHLDNDPAGQSLTQKILDDFPNSIDSSPGYMPYNDMNDWWIANKQGLCHNTISSLAERF